MVVVQQESFFQSDFYEPVDFVDVLHQIYNLKEMAPGVVTAVLHSIHEPKALEVFE